MLVTARTFKAEISVEELTIRLVEQKVEHIQSDVTEMKTDIRSNRDTIADVKDSVAALRVEMKDGFAAANQKFSELTAAIVVLDGKFERLDEKTTAIDRKIDAKTDVLTVRIDERFATLDRKIDEKTDVLAARIDERFTTLDRKIDEKTDVLAARMAENFTTLDRKIDDTKSQLIECVNALFDRKFFRAIGVIIAGAVPATTVPPALLQKTSLGFVPVIAVVMGISAVILFGTFLATRTHR
jgi:chromosome segregation ATPase